MILPVVLNHVSVPVLNDVVGQKYELQLVLMKHFQDIFRRIDVHVNGDIGVFFRKPRHNGRKHIHTNEISSAEVQGTVFHMLDLADVLPGAVVGGHQALSIGLKGFAVDRQKGLVSHPVK